MQDLKPKFMHCNNFAIGQANPGEWYLWHKEEKLIGFHTVLAERLAKMDGFEKKALAYAFAGAMNSAHSAGYKLGQRYSQHEIQKALGLAPEEE